MLSLRTFLYIYLIGGVTFIPLLALSIFLIAWYTLPKPSSTSQSQDDTVSSTAGDPALLLRPDDSDVNLKTSTDSLAEKFHRKHESDVAAGYFAVVREYVPGGVNGKPPEKISSAGEVVAQESPSVYQTMYRSLFERKDKPSVDPKNDNAAKGVKKTTNNVFYIVLRHGHLMLYDDERQLEVRYVISLEYHNVDIYAGAGETINESELWIKRNAIRLSRRDTGDMAEKLSAPFFLFSENLSDKEDFYFALLKNMKREGSEAPPAVLEFDTRHIITLVQRLHSTEEQLQTRWLNALIGRMFLAMYRTQKMEQIVRQKLTKKIARVKKPGFITKLALQKIDMGTEAPLVTNPRLKDLTVNGDCTVEADVNYSGSFRIETAATVRIDLGTRLKAREVDIVLAVTCKKLNGHVLLRFKPPPSNRLWLTFDKVPKVELALEPIVSSRQITYGFILRAMESRIMEVIAETIVLPFWDDIPFLDTTNEQFRGGIWKHDSKSQETTEIKDEVAEDEAEAGSNGEGTKTPDHMSKAERIISMPDLPHTNPALAAAKGAAKQKSISSMKEIVGNDGTQTPERSKPRDIPRMMRSSSFASAADPMISPSHAPAHSPVLSPEAASKRDSMLKDLSARSLGTSPPEAADEESELPRLDGDRQRNTTDASEMTLERLVQTSRRNSDESGTTLQDPALASRTPTMDTLRPKQSSQEESKLKGFATTARNMAGDREKTMASINAAREAAQKWGWGVLARGRNREGELRSPTAGEHKPLNEPVGRGQPLPPPGVPLPRPPKPSIFALPKRQSISKPGPSASSTSLASSGVATPVSEAGSSSPPKQPLVPPPLPERRRRQSAMHNADDAEDELLVVAAPTESEPTTPAPIENEHQDDFFGHSEDIKENREGKVVEKVEEHPRLTRPEPPPLPARGEVEVVEKEEEHPHVIKPGPPPLPARSEVEVVEKEEEHPCVTKPGPPPLPSRPEPPNSETIDK